MAIWVKRIFPVISGIAVLTGIVFGINAYVAQFATADEVKQIEQSVLALSERLENKIQEDRLHALQQRIWSLEDRYGGIGTPNAPAEVKTGYREQKYEAEIIKQKIRGNE